MFNKESCRNCGFVLKPKSNCMECNEISLWQCFKCNNIEEYIHMHCLKNNNLTSNQTIKIETK